MDEFTLIQVIHKRIVGKPGGREWIAGKQVEGVLYVACTTKTLQIKLVSSSGKCKLQSNKVINVNWNGILHQRLNT